MEICAVTRILASLAFFACPSMISGRILRTLAKTGPTSHCGSGTPAPDIRESFGGTWNLERPGTGPELVLVHVEKTAGQFAFSRLLSYASGKLHVVFEASAMPTEFFGDNFFRIGLVREPCDYYVSEYFWGAKGCGWLSKELNASGLSKRFYQDAESKRAQFKDWLYFVSGLDQQADKFHTDGSLATRDRCGLFSMRLWSQNLNEKAVKDMNVAYMSNHTNPACAFMDVKREGRPESRNGRCPCPLGNCAAVASAQHHRTCKNELTASNLARFDCWIRSDHADADMSECMQKYAERGGSVTLVSPPNDSDVKNNNQERPSCESMFDAESEQLVNTIDGNLRMAFGYTQCCKPHWSNKMPQF